MGKFGSISLRKATRQSRHPTLIISLVYAVFLCDHTTDCEAYSFTTYGYGIFNVDSMLYTRRGVRYKQVYKSRLGGPEKLSPCPARGSNAESPDFNYSLG